MIGKNNARICVPVCETRAIDLREGLLRASEMADLLELRLDYLQGDELFKALRNLPALISASPRPVIVTLRPIEQGGQREMDNLTRLIFWVEHFLNGKPHIDFADIELDLAQLFLQREKDEGRGLLDWERVICSHHDFKGIPGDLWKIYDELKATPARLLKIAFQAQDITDCLPVFELLKRARQDKRELIAIAMGSHGIPTRILGPARGSALAYGALDTAHQSAPGQITARELRELYRVDKLNPQTLITGLIGSPLSHSLSPHLHNAALQALEVDAVYLPFETGNVDEFIRRMAHPRTREIEWRLRGLSVTTPHKVAVMEWLDWIEPSALEIGAVNTIVVEGEELHGYNTDAEAFLTPLRERGLKLRDARCAVIGAGGAARSAIWSLLDEGARVSLFVRDEAKAQPLTHQFAVECRQLAGASFAGFDLVVNATPLGTLGEREAETPARTNQLRGARLVYDLVYNPQETLFQREARAAGCDNLGGLPMLIAQAAAQFRLWMEKPAPLDVMNDAALRKL